MKKSLFISLTLLFGLLVGCSAQSLDKEGAGKQQRLTLNSNILGESREVLLRLPKHWDARHSESFARYVILDAEQQFEHLAPMLDYLASGVNPAIPEGVIVGIINRNRIRDFTPVKLETLPGGRPAGPLYQQSGNAGAFLDFLDQELNPWLNARLGQPGPTVLIGHSFGGLLALEALRRQQPMFNAYLVLDASLWYDSPTYADELEQALTQGKLTGKPLYMAISNQATTPGLGRNDYHKQRNLALAKHLSALPSQQLIFHSEFFSDEDHHSLPHIGVYQGIRWLMHSQQLDIFAEDFSVTEVVSRFKHLSESQGIEIKPQYHALKGLLRQAQRQKLAQQQRILTQLIEHYYPGSTLE
ncbi:alpha/beta hydrolase [Shewanella algae]|uniref:alpha/beta hydrolase n=1 Tax=Shewanella algae TaxID=38313 RepID=UPI0031F4AD3D